MVLKFPLYLFTGNSLNTILYYNAFIKDVIEEQYGILRLNNNILSLEKQIALAALQWHVENDLVDMLEDTPVDRTAPPDLSEIQGKIEHVSVKNPVSPSKSSDAVLPIMGAAEAIKEAQNIADACKNLEELKNAIQNFDGLSLKKTATNMVFADGNPKADIMVIGEAPGADEDMQGKPFMGMVGQLLDKILAAIELGRSNEETSKSVYTTNMLNWRPPGNRTPTSQEIEISLPFIKKHIELVQPKYLILLGAVSGKALLNQKGSISKLRGCFYDYHDMNNHKAETKEKILSLVTYHPAYLLRTPAQKRAVWNDMLMLKAELDKA